MFFAFGKNPRMNRIINCKLSLAFGSFLFLRQERCIIAVLVSVNEYWAWWRRRGVSRPWTVDALKGFWSLERKFLFLGRVGVCSLPYLLSLYVMWAFHFHVRYYNKHVNTVLHMATEYCF